MSAEAQALRERADAGIKRSKIEVLQFCRKDTASRQGAEDAFESAISYAFECGMLATQERPLERAFDVMRRLKTRTSKQVAYDLDRSESWVSKMRTIARAHYKKLDQNQDSGLGIHTNKDEAYKLALSILGEVE